ncbi:zinc finger BED domain-containing protein 4-like [Ixodes scapularis]|uniref:zinc finger BED domain-containing protein 4-like n=1 Tax=Ixodes scapularis TaxID=6945 RepID=UPI001C38467C|nr:zinc finger BED domain-containing protein 4-like [Ixodes scapularis]
MVTNIRDKVIEEAAKIRDAIKCEVKGRLVSLKVDSATRLDRSIVGINAQFLVPGTQAVRTLSMREVKERHTAEHLKSVILEVLKSYEIMPDQIYSVTTDNAANLVKSVSLIVEHEGTNFHGVHAINGAESDDDEQFWNERESDIIFEELLGAGSGIAATGVALRGVRCAAHTLQLAVEDALKSADVKVLLDKCRAICKKLRVPTTMMLVKKLNLKKPILDCPTRWNSTCDMLERLIERKPFCIDMGKSSTDFGVSDETWAAIEGIIASLRPAKVATKALQKEQLSLGDFFGIWQQCSLETAKIDCVLAQRLTSSLKQRLKSLLQNDVFQACVFLDPRFNVLLLEDEKKSARDHLMKTWVALKKVQKPFLVAPASASSGEESTAGDSDDDLDALLRLKEAASRTHQASLKAADTSIRPLLDSFLREPRLKRSEDIFKYWENQKGLKPELYEVAEQTLAKKH